MVKSTRALLQRSLVERYTQLRERLAMRLGSQDLAGEALHETWIKLNEGNELSPVSDPEGYLLRAALNTASTLSAAQRRVLGLGEITDILSIADDAPDPERIAIGRSELAQVWKVLGELSVRQRHVLLESFTGHATHADLAAQYGVSVRAIQMDLREAVLHCARRTRRKNPFAHGGSRVSVR